MMMKVDGYIEVVSRYNNQASCGHLILPGDTIGFDPEKKQTRCQFCWKNMKARAGLRRDRAIQEEMKIV
jgi:hypothetical protein